MLYCYLFIYFCFLNRAQHVGRVLSTGPRFSLSFFRSERGDRGFFILWMIVGSLPGLVFLYLFHRLFLVYTFVVVELACSISARPPVSTRQHMVCRYCCHARVWCLQGIWTRVEIPFPFCIALHLTFRWLFLYLSSFHFGLFFRQSRTDRDIIDSKLPLRPRMFQGCILDEQNSCIW